MTYSPRSFVILVLLSSVASVLTHREIAHGEVRVLDARMHHLRSGAVREWADFPAQAEGSELNIRFQAKSNAAEQTLLLRHRDMKQTWKLSINGKDMGRMSRDENDMITAWPIAPGLLLNGENHLRIEAASDRTDDVLIGNIRIDSRPREKVFSEATVEVEVVDAAGMPLPCRLTIVDANGTLVPIGAASNKHLAVREGIVCTSTGKAQFGLAAGKYTLYATRGFEYGLAAATLDVAEGDRLSKKLTLRREVPTPGYVSCDTHVHTVTFSRHGDATIQERMVTLPAEGVELPIATDHNLHINYEAYAREAGVRRWFTPVIGNEVTTSLGHFNVFPVADGAEPPDHRPKDWSTIFKNIFATPGVQVVVLNHARDLHGGFRPFGPKQHNALVGENLDGWKLRATAMEVCNSAALQTDPMRLFHDWFGLLNRGLSITPIGSSDSHEVARKLVAQGRTYIRCPDEDPGNIDVATAVKSLLEGRVLVSMGLLTEMTVNGRYEPGDLAAVDGDVEIKVKVSGPSWTKADRVTLFANGVKVREAKIEPTKSIVKFQATWTLPRPRHDVHLVAIATGPGVTAPYWRIAKAYQPTSPVWKPYVLGATGAVWLDVDGDGRRTSAHAYATREFQKHGKDLPALVQALRPYDEIVAAHAANLLAAGGKTLLDNDLNAALKKAAEPTRRGFGRFFAAWRENQQARSQ